MANTSILVSSLAEITHAKENGFSGPVLCIPFGADDTTPCRFFGSVNEISEEELESMLEHAYPRLGLKRQLHMIQALQHFNPGAKFYRVST